MRVPSPRGPGTDIHVLVVDDSAVMRQSASLLLARHAGVRVSVAADPLLAFTQISRERPDVILLDIEMPRMDGLTFLRQLMARDPIPVVICSAFAGRGTALSLSALHEGAVDIVAKSQLGLHGFLRDSAMMLVDTLRAAAQAKLRRRGASRVAARTPAAPAPARSDGGGGSQRVVAIGASTGGTEAIRELLSAMPASAPPIVIAQHMPAGFTTGFAEQLDQLCRIEVAEARHGEPLRDGRALVAPGGRHLRLRRAGQQLVVAIDDGPLVSRHRPSVDALFESVARAAGGHAVGVILTGMGDDGAQGLLRMRQAGAATIAQDEATCVVFGMPQEAIACGAVDEVLPLPKIAGTILRRARAAARSAR